jgi:serine/threonine protein kinase/Flp pilus assembly protein TadD
MAEIDSRAPQPSFVENVTKAASDTEGSITSRPEKSTPSALAGYEILDEIAHGGMGVVYRARQRSLDRIVAVKVILAAAEPGSTEFKRFQTEAGAAARLDHPHIVPVYDFGLETGRPFIAMGHVAGESLATRLKRLGSMPPRDAAEIVLKVAEAIEYAHRHGIIHRDLKPGNILIGPNGQPNVTDFGLAKCLDSAHSLTGTGQVLGTPAYMAPEQAAGDREVGPTADVYSLGATLFALLTGRPPFEAASVPELLVKISEEVPPSPSQLRAGVPRDLEIICLRCLEREPTERYSSAADLSECLGRFLAGRRIHRRDRGGARRGVIAACLLAVAIVVAIGGWLIFNRGKSDRSNDAETTTVQVADRVEKLRDEARHIKTESVEDAARAVSLWEQVVMSARAGVEENPPGPSRDRLQRVEIEAVAELARAQKALAVARNDEQFAIAIRNADEKLLPDRSSPLAEYRYAEAAAAIAKVFADRGLNVLELEVVQVASALQSQSLRFRELVVCGLERWEAFATAAKLPDPIHLRQVQGAIDSAPWRIQLRQARASGDNVAFAETAAAALKEQLSRDQVEVISLTILAHAMYSRPEARDVMRQAKQKEPASYWVHSHLAAAAYTAGRTGTTVDSKLMGDAVAALRDAIRTRPASPLPHLQLAAIFRLLNNSAAAQTESDRAAEKTFPEAWRLLAESRRLRQEKRYADAIAAATKAVTAAPAFPHAHVELGVGQKIAGDFAAAESAFRAGIEVAADEGEAARLLREAFQTVDEINGRAEGPIKARLANRVRAAQYLRLIVENRTDASAQAFSRLAANTVRPDGFDNRIRYREEAIRRDPKDSNHLYWLASDLNNLARSPERAESAARQAMEMKPKSHWEQWALANALVGGGKYDDAVKELRIYNEVKPAGGKEYGLAAMAEAIRRAEQPTKLLPQMESLLADKDCGPRVAALIGWVHLSAGRESDADRMLRTACARHLSEANAFLTAYDLARAGRVEDALRFAAYELQRMSQWNWYWSAYSFAAIRSGDIAGAITAGATSRRIALERLATFPDEIWDNNAINGTVKANAALGRAQIAAGDFSAAVETLRDTQLDPFEAFHNGYPGGSEGYTADFASALLGADKADEAERVACDIIAIRPRQGVARQVLGEILIARNKTAEAIVELRTAEKLDPLDGLASFHLGRALLLNGNRSEAIQAFERAIGLHDKRRLRIYRPVPIEAAVALLSANPTKPDEFSQAIKWMKGAVADWRQRIEVGKTYDLVAASQVLEKLLKSEAAKTARTSASLDRMSAGERSTWLALWADVEKLQGEATRRRPAQDGDLFAQLWPFEREREVATWVLKSGGKVLLQLGTLKTLIATEGDLPRDSFRVYGISLSGLPISDADLPRISRLIMLRELFIDGTRVTDTGVLQLLRDVPTLARLSLENTQVTDSVAPSLHSLVDVYVRRTKVSAASIASMEKVNPQVSTLHGTSKVTNTASAPGFALRFDGTAYVELPITYEMGKPMTLEATVMLEPELHDEYMTVIGCRGEGDAGFTLDIRRPREPRANTLGSENRWTSTDAASAGARVPWLKRTHVAASFDGQKLRVFLEGKLAGEAQPNNLDASLKAPIRIGVHGDSRRGFVGVIDNVRISTSARYEKNFSPPSQFSADADTIGLYHFDEGTGNVARDSSGKGNEGKIHGAKWIKTD